MISSLWPAGLPASAPATPALSSCARLPQPPQLVAEAEGLLSSSVRPRSVRDLTWPRSTSSVPVQPDVHQSVPASPSIAFDAGLRHLR